MIDVTGNWASGTIAQMFISQTKKKIATMNGTYRSPFFLPMTSYTMPLRTKS
jgi:hypothetical protein